MIGGLLKSTSRLALVAAAGVIAGGIGAAQAADLGGDCCADLEERVAELEATTARKGNRKVSLQIYGQVNEMVLFWDDGFMNDVYQVTNNVSRSRIGFRGSAKIDSDWSAGFRIEHGVRTADSGAVAQFDAAGFDPGDDLGANAFDLRHAFWYIDSKTLGRISVGQTDTPLSSTFTLTLANINHVEADPTSMAAGFNLRGTDGTLFAETWGDLANPSQFSVSRRNVVKYETPTFGGFQASAAWGEADIWAVSLAYAGEFSGFRLAAKIAYGEITDSNLDCERAGGSTTSHRESDCQLWSVGASIMHVPTGLFLTGNYGEHNDDLRGAGVDATDTAWYVHGGIEQKFNALGKTTLYGEYGEQENGLIVAPYGGTTMSFWGVGLVQSIDAAAMDLYVFYRAYSSEVPITFGDPLEDLTVVGAGALIKF